jgi:predicted negative regulator of RcsB-dependent stress response
MQAQDTAMAYFFKLWSWVEANAKHVFIGAGILAVAIVLASYYFWRQNQTEIIAGQALTQLLISTNSDAGQLANAYLKIAADYSDTQTGGRALMLGATTLFESGKYPEAQAQFKKYLDQHSADTFSAQAALGVAACLDAQGQMDPAASAYRRVISGFSDPNAVDAARYALAKINEQQGKLADAENLYGTVARNNPNTPLGSEAAFRAVQLRAKLPPTTPPKTPPTSFNPGTKP